MYKQLYFDGDRMKTLAGAAAALNLYNNTEQISKAAQNPLGTASVSVSVGASKSESREATTAKGSSLAAGCFIKITAKGTNDGKEDDSDSGDILIQGSTVNAAKNVTLDAKDDIMLFAARNDNETHSTNESSGGSIGVSVGAGQTGITLSANRARVKK